MRFMRKVLTNLTVRKGTLTSTIRHRNSDGQGKPLSCQDLFESWRTTHFTAVSAVQPDPSCQWAIAIADRSLFPTLRRRKGQDARIPHMKHVRLGRTGL